MSPGLSEAFRGLADAETKRLNSAYEQGLLAMAALQDLLVQAGPRYIKALKRVRVSAAKRQKS